MKRTILEANSESKTIKALGIELNVDLNKVKVLINGTDIAEMIVLKDLRIVEE